MTRIALGWLAALALLAPGSSAQEGRVEVPFQLVHGQRVAYQVELNASYPGTIQVDADWPGNRTLVLRLVPSDGSAAVARRIGTPPLHLEVEVPEAGIDSPRTWTLTLRGNPTGGGGEGLLTIRLPDGTPPPPPPPPGTRPDDHVPFRGSIARRVADGDLLAAHRGGGASETVAWPATIPASQAPWLGRAQAFARDLRSDPRPDTCRWQRPFVDQQLDWAHGTLPPPDDATERLLADLVQAIEEVEALRTSDDPILAGPAPADPRENEAWQRARIRRLRPLVSRLDKLLNEVERHQAEAFGTHAWASRLVTCLTACERHFDVRAVVGPIDAPNLDLADQQWDRLIAAHDVLDAWLSRHN